MTEPPGDHGRHCDAVETEAAAFASAARDADLDAPVPSCPGWSVAYLIRHLGATHRWAAGIVAARSPRSLGLRELGVEFPSAPAGHVPWFTEGAARLVGTLRTADPRAELWTWGPGGNTLFWSRRMLHETAVHRCDLDLALGREPSVPAEHAADGVSELLANLEAAAAFSPAIENLRGDGRTLAFAGTDVGARWTVRLLPDRLAWDRWDGPSAGDAQPADATVSGGVSDLYLYLWGRRKLGDPRLTFTGAEDLLAHWTENSPI